MAIDAGVRFGPYEILSVIGSGGMGKVYRARDTKLNRDVALKVLPDPFSSDPERLARFRREAQFLASLNHPSVAAIYGFEEFDAVQALVLELVEGRTLAERLSGTVVPLGEALTIARQVAEALEAAHEKGIVHRDLKPTNIALGPEGRVKVLDFGLAKLIRPPGVEQDTRTHVSDMSTMLASSPGTILGTAAYMSPEQAKGQDADRLADVWAFGCVLYEMLSGRAAFAGGTTSEIISEVLKSEPDWQRLPAETPEGIRRLLRRCLNKDRRRRLHDIADARLEIEEAQDSPSAPVRGARVVSKGRERLMWASVLAVVAAIALVRWWSVRAVPISPEMRVEITTPPTTDPVSLAISPDGAKLVFVATDQDKSRLWLRALDAPTARSLAGTDSASYPFWSPDSRSVGFFADGKLKRIDIDAGSVQTLAVATAGRGGAWTADGMILFAPQAGPIFRIAATGGERAQLTQVDAERSNHRFPQLLPDGRHFLYYTTNTPRARGVYVGQVDGSPGRRLLDADAAAAYASGQLLFVRQRTLFAQPLDPVRLELSGSPVAVASDVAVDVGVGVASVSASATGGIVYRTGLARGQRQFAWFDRSGKEIGRVGPPDETMIWGPSMSPDGHTAALTRTVDGNQDVWLLDLVRGVFRRFTFGEATELNPMWSPDGSRIAFSSNRKGDNSLYRAPATGDGDDELLLTTPIAKQPADWSNDGRYLLYRSQDPRTRYDIWALRLNGEGQTFPVVQTTFDERDGQFSPDGKWIAYESDESGQFEIYVQPFPGPGRKWPISTSGGAQVRWARDGKELFYIGLDERLMSVSVRLDSQHQIVEASSPVPLFWTHVGGAVTVSRQQYAPSSDGHRFLMNTITEERTSPITLLLNWKGR